VIDDKAERRCIVFLAGMIIDGRIYSGDLTHADALGLKVDIVHFARHVKNMAEEIDTLRANLEYEKNRVSQLLELPRSVA
jgi:hypothetical protein